MTANPKTYEGDLRKRIAYENACDCLYFGMGWADWVSDWLSKEEKEEVWDKAYYDMSDGCNEWMK